MIISLIKTYIVLVNVARVVCTAYMGQGTFRDIRGPLGISPVPLGDIPRRPPDIPKRPPVPIEAIKTHYIPHTAYSIVFPTGSDVTQTGSDVITLKSCRFTAVFPYRK